MKMRNKLKKILLNTTTELKKLKYEARTLGEEGNKFKKQMDKIQSALKSKQKNVN